jgi:hypothetical protein
MAQHGTLGAERRLDVRTIWKYPLPASGRVSMPAGSLIRTIQMQGDAITLWAEVDREALSVERVFLVAGTGSSIPEQIVNYVGTVQQPPYVWHVYEIK